MFERIVRIKSGKLRGRYETDINNNFFYCFQGIPYAKPPTGDLRFKAPVAPNSWNGIRDATKEGSISIQKTQDSVIGSEDCLFLNVYTPEDIDNTLKPVLVFIHGGSFIGGSGGTDIFGPEFLITENIVIVTFNYRLGILGFLQCDDPNSEMFGNAGLKDAVMVLKWVQENIKVFSGDPHNVTLAGGSAGSGMAHCLMLSPMTKSSMFNPWSIGKQNLKEIAKCAGCQMEKNDDIIKFLRSISADKLMDVQHKLQNVNHVHKYRIFAPTIEKESNNPAIIIKHPLDIVKSSMYNKVPMLVGYNSCEGLASEFIYGIPSKEFGNFNEFHTKIPCFYNIPINSEYSISTANKIKHQYYEQINVTKTNIEKFFDMQTDILILIGLHNSISFHSKNLNCPIYLYKFSIDTSFNVMKKIFQLNYKGACHGDELGYLFKTAFTKTPLSKSEAKNVKKVTHLWTNFMRTGNPNPKNSELLDNAIWKPIETKPYNYLNINTTCTAGLNLDMERIKFWEEIALHNPYESKY